MHGAPVSYRVAMGMLGGWAVAGVAVLALTACGGGSDSPQSADPTSTSAGAPTTTATSSPTATMATAAPEAGDVDRLGLPRTVRNGEPLRLVGMCPSGSDYIHLSLAFTSVEHPTTAVAFVFAETSTFAGQVGDGSVSALVAVNLEPGDYVVHPRCVVERTPPPKEFASFTITVTGRRSRATRHPKEWQVVLRGNEARPRSIFASECWRHDGRVALVHQTDGGFSNVFEATEGDVVSIEPVIVGSAGCRALP